MKIPNSVISALDKRKSKNNLRILKTCESGVDFYSNDYLGISRYLNQSSKKHYSGGSTGSRLVSGNCSEHVSIENRLSEIFHVEASLLFNSGYDANLGLISSIAHRKDLILYDELVHASVIDGLTLSKAKSYKFKHNDVFDLESKLSRFSGAYENTYIVVESVYSMDGDVAPLLEMSAICNSYRNTYLIVDEAHGLGVCGEAKLGLSNHSVVNDACVARVYTFGKSLGVHGACVLASQKVISFLVNHARSFIYSTSLPPASVLSIEDALDVFQEKNFSKSLDENIFYYMSLVKSLDARYQKFFTMNETSIQTIILGTNEAVDELEALCAQHGYRIKAIKSPTVRHGTERVRICLHAYNTQAEIKEIVRLVFEFINLKSSG